MASLIIVITIAFALLSCSAAFSQSDRRRFLETAGTASAAASFPLLVPQVSNADYGKSSNMKIPSYIDFLIEKNQQGLEVKDALYSGADLEVQLRRIGEAASRLPEVASLAEDKKWSQVQGIITGPLGTLLQTLNSVVSASKNDKRTAAAAKAVKADLLDINAGVTRKDVAACVKAAGKAESDLEAFVNIAFK